MTLEENIRRKLATLKSTTVKLYSNTGDVYEEHRDINGDIHQTKLNISSPGYVIDNKPDLDVCTVLPWLCLGSQDVAHDHSLLKEHKITHILSIGVPSPLYSDIITKFMEAYDVDNFDIEQIFESCFQFIDTAKNLQGKIYVHCNAGISRSATIVAAYLIDRENISHTDALRILKNVRPKINPNPGFMKVLEQYAKQKTTQLY